MVPSIKMRILGNKQLACRRVKVSLENTEFEELKGLELRGALWLKERWQTQGEIKLWGSIHSPQCRVRKKRLGSNREDH